MDGNGVPDAGFASFLYEALKAEDEGRFEDALRDAEQALRRCPKPSPIERVIEKVLGRLRIKLGGSDA